MTLWTPQGEHEVPREPREEPFSAEEMEAEVRARVEEMTPEERERAEEFARELAAARERLAQMPAEAAVANHLRGLYELAAIHLTAQEPNLSKARLAIDAMGALLDNLRGRLGEDEAELRDSRSNLQMLYVQLASAKSDPEGQEAEDG